MMAGMSLQSESVMEVPADTFELRLAIARFTAGNISANEAGLMVGVSGTAWRNWEAGRSPGARKPAMLAFIAQQLGVDPDWLRDGGPLRTQRAPHPDGPSGGLEEECAIRDSNPEPADLVETAPDLRLAQPQPGNELRGDVIPLRWKRPSDAPVWPAAS